MFHTTIPEYVVQVGMATRANRRHNAIQTMPVIKSKKSEFYNLRLIEVSRMRINLSESVVPVPNSVSGLLAVSNRVFLNIQTH